MSRIFAVCAGSLAVWATVLSTRVVLGATPGVLFADLPLAPESTLPSVPIARLLEKQLVVPTGASTAIRLDADVRIPDAGVLNWPVSLPWGDGDAHSNVTAASITLRGIYHSDPRDLRVELWHAGRRVTVADGARASSQLGEITAPIERPAFDEMRAMLEDETLIQGRGVDVTFEDVSQRATNLLLGASATQSSTLLNASAALAVDGNTGGFVGSGSVAHTSVQLESSPEAWWEGDLRPKANASLSHLASAPVSATGDAIVGTVRLWGRDVSPDRDEVQVVRIRTTAGIATGSTFRLRFTFSGLTGLTKPINAFAVATRADEAPQSAPGGAPGDSMQTALEGIPVNATDQASAAADLFGIGPDGVSSGVVLGLLGSVRVTRSVSDAFGAYAWSITFATLAGDVPLLQPEQVVITTTGSPARVEVIEVAKGSSSSSYNYATSEGIRRAQTSGTISPAYVMLLPAPLGDVPLAVARAAALWEAPISPSALRGQDQRTASFHVPVEMVTSAASAAARAAALADGNASSAHAGGLVGAVRVQMAATNTPLALAEVQAFAPAMRTLQSYASGNAVVGRDGPAAALLAPGASLLPDATPRAPTFRRFHSLEPMRGLWSGSAAPLALGRAGGQWTLSVTDAVRRRAEPLRVASEVDKRSTLSAADAAALPAPTAEEAGSATRPLAVAHGAGALTGWLLNLTLSDGRQRIVRSDVSFEVAFLPSHGDIHLANTTAAAGGRAAGSSAWAAEAGLRKAAEVAADPLTARLRAPCLGLGVGDCAGNFGLGHLLTTDARGEARPAVQHRVTWDASDLRLVYTPDDGFLGEDLLQVRAWVLGTASDKAAVRLHVRNCRMSDLKAERAGTGPRAASAEEACSADTTPDLTIRAL